MSMGIVRELAEEEHTAIVLGKDASFPRSMAINMLPPSKVAGKAALLQQIVKDEKEEPKLRRLAAIALWRVDTPEARAALLDAAQTVTDPTVLTGVVKVLGRVGGERALEAIRTIRARSEGPLAAQASFAAALITHRLGLLGDDLDVPQSYEEMPQSGQGRIDFVAPPSSEVERFVAALRQEPYDVDISSDSLQQVRCTGATWMLALSKTFVAANSIRALRSRKSVAGLLAGRNTSSERYAISYLVLTAPARQEDQVDILVHRTTGQRAWAGALKYTGSGNMEFEIHTAGRIGIAPVELAGVWHGHGRLEMTRSVSGSRVLEKQVPIRLEAFPPA